MSDVAQQQERVQRMLLMGCLDGDAGLPSLAAALEAALHMPVTVANPFADFDLGPVVDPGLLKRDAPALLVACGLAMRRAP